MRVSPSNWIPIATAGGIEPPTPTLTASCSAELSYAVIEFFVLYTIMDINRIAIRIAKSIDEEDLSEESRYWWTYLKDAVQQGESLIAKLNIMLDFLEKPNISPEEEWRRLVILAITAKNEIPNDEFMATIGESRKLHDKIQTPFYQVSPNYSELQKMDPLERNKIEKQVEIDNEAMRKLHTELETMLKPHTKRR